MLEIGSVVDGKYKILSRIGSGGMSVVYLALNEKANKSWAVKEMIKGDFRAYALDKREIELMKRLRHPRLPSVVDVIERADSFLIVMDYVEGRTLENWILEHGAQSEAQVLIWARQLCEVLLYLHSLKPPVIYRDMKPANVMIKPDGSITLIDFGAAREYHPGKQRDTVSLGTLGYAAPEQYEGHGQSDARTDIYCLGALMFHMLTGETPVKIRPVRQIVPEISPGMETIIETCTKENREERYRSGGELLYALDHVWEQDACFRRQQRKYLMRFLLPMGLAVLFVLVGAFLGNVEWKLRRQTYENYLLAAGSAVTREEAVGQYERAIALEPDREDAYLYLLQEVFLEDELLSVEENRQIRRILLSYKEGRGDQTYEKYLQKNKAGYALFAYEMGISYFYKYEETENKKMAYPYLNAAAESGVLSEKKEERAKRLALVASYYGGIGITDAAGDQKVSYRDYWNDLVELTSGNLVELDNERTALVMYEELLGQIISRGSLFLQAGVEMKEMREQLTQIRHHLEEDFQETKDAEKDIWEAEREKLEELLLRADQVVTSAYEEQRKGR